MLIVLIYIKRPKQFLEAGAAFPVEPSSTLSRERLKTPGEMRRKGILTLLGSAKKSEPGLNIHCCILHVGVLFARAEGKEPR